MVQGAWCRVLGARYWVLGAGFQANQYFIMYCVIAIRRLADGGEASSSGFLFVF
jgi:hypothetical protein